MTPARKAIGLCRVCGERRQLTFEHIPPRCAFNAESLKSYTLAEFWKLQAGERARYASEQRGAGEYALCTECNSTRGGTWYVPEFCIWAQVIGSQLQAVPTDGSIAAVRIGLRHVRPARFVKQVVSMLLAINEPAFGDDHPALRQFVTELDRRGLPTNHGLYLALFNGDTARSLPATPWLHSLGSTEPGRGLVTELSFPPFTCALTIDGPRLGRDACPITDFAHLGPEDVEEVRLRLPLNWTVVPDL
jgi:hypothetical protein